MKYYGKEKCRILKQIRAEIARNNDIEYVIEECPHQGDCKGTCPKCEEEVRELESKLAARRSLGKKVIVAGVAAGISLGVTGACTPDKPLVDGMLVPAKSEVSVTTPIPGDDNGGEPDGENGTEPVELMGDYIYLPDAEEQPTDDPDPLMGEPAPDFEDEETVDGTELMGKVIAPTDGD
jgi:hypothetical protein